MNGFERVHAWWDYWDGIREGVADFMGRPHRFVADWDVAADDYAATFSLYPIDDATLHIAIEKWAIWRRWVAARRDGTTSHDTHPALSEERERYYQLEQDFNNRMADGIASPHHPVAEFRRIRDEFYDFAGAATFEVSWNMTPQV